MKAIEKYECHPSIIKIEEQGFLLTTFKIYIGYAKFEGTWKAYQKDNIKLLKDNNEFYCVNF